MIELREFSKYYADSPAVRSLSLTVEPGQLWGVIGRNGAGKTTTLRAITGIIPPSGGTLRVAGFDVQQDPVQVKRRTAYVPDDPQLFADLTVEQHLRFQASVYQVDQPGPAIEHWLERFELAGKRHARADSLSRGMRQKLAICAAYLQRPAALLLDEPMTGLDPQAIRQLKESIVEQAQAGAAVMISSHLLAMVEDICTHVLVLDEGRKKFSGQLDQLKRRLNDSGQTDNQSLEAAFFLTLDQVEGALEREVHGGPGIFPAPPRATPSSPAETP